MTKLTDANLCITSKNKLASVSIVHCCYLIFKKNFMYNPTRAKIDHLKRNSEHHEEW